MKVKVKSTLLAIGAASAFSLAPATAFSANQSYEEIIEKAEATIGAIEAEASLAERVPDEYKENLSVGMTFRFPPLRWMYEGTRLGPEYDLARAIGKVLDTEIEFIDVAFDSIIPSLKAQRIDMAVISMADQPDRQEQVTFVNYYKSGTGIEVVKGNPHNIQNLADLCGYVVAIQQGVNGVPASQEQSKQCEADGKKPIDIQLYESSNDATLAVVSGRADATINDYPAAVYESQTIKDGEALELLDEMVTEDSIYGIVLRKSEEGFQKLVQAALQHLMDEGIYEEIYTNHGLEQGLIPEATINAGT